MRAKYNFVELLIIQKEAHYWMKIRCMHEIAAMVLMW